MPNDTLDLMLTFADLPASLGVEIINGQTVKLHGITADSLVAHGEDLLDGPLRELVEARVRDTIAAGETERYHRLDYDHNR